MEDTAPTEPVTNTPAEEGPGEPPAEIPSPAPVDPVNPQQAFKDGYTKLIAETGYIIEYKPEFILRDDGTYSMVINTSVAPKKS